MRKPKRLTKAELAPFVVEFPRAMPARITDQGGSAPPPLPAPDLPPVVLDWAALFGNGNPVEIEVGFGKGLFLVNSAVANPGRNYFGIEIVRKYQLYATTRIAVRQLANAKTCSDDARRVLRENVPPASAAVVHVYFPDPWWKARHKKRLLFTDDFAALVLRVLVPGGVLKFATDVPDYFEMVTGLLATVPAFRPLPPPPDHEPAHDMDYLTNFERKARQQGMPIYRAEYEKS